jgi:hypothetical protein
LNLGLDAPSGLGTSLAKIFFGVGLTFPFVTGIAAVVFFQEGLISRVEVYPWDQILSVLFVLAVFVTPESICVYLFQSKVIKTFLARMAFIVAVVFLYGNYVFLIPPSVYTIMPETAGTLLWAVWPPLATLAVGFAVGRVESKQVFTAANQTMFDRGTRASSGGGSGAGAQFRNS